MDILDGIKQMLDKSGMNKAQLASALGRTRNSVYNMFADKADVRVDTVAKMAEHMGYELVLRSDDDEIVITPRSSQ